MNGALFEDRIDTLDNALVLPERHGVEKRACGVLDAQGKYCDLSKSWVRARQSTTEPALLPDEPVVELPGRFLYAGQFRGHFGHFLVESTARLWALERLENQIDGILYIPYGNIPERRLTRAVNTKSAFFKLLGTESMIRTCVAPTRVEKLYVPELGFGWRERYAGSASYRRVMRERLGAKVAPAPGVQKLYISRARLGAGKGGVFNETLIERSFAEAGYTILHPEKVDLETQIAHYKSARKVVALDGSALHFAAFFLPAGGDVAIIKRRSKANTADYVCQFESFCGITPLVVDAIRADWVQEDRSRVDFRSIGELDFGILFEKLCKEGFLGSVKSFDEPSPDEMLAERTVIEAVRGPLKSILTDPGT